GSDQVRAGHQPQDRQRARPRSAADFTRPRRRGDRMKRREFITLFGGAAVAWPLAARAQQGNAPWPLVACLFGGSKAGVRRNFDGFLQGMRELGYVEGQNWIFEARYADGDLARSPRLAEELLRLKPEVIAVGTMASVLGFKKLTDTIPIVSPVLVDPVGF